MSMSISEKMELLADEFLNLGVDIAYGIPGSGPIALFLDAYIRKGGQFLVCRNEASAPIMAGTIGKREGKPLLAICANGTARVNLLSGITHCWFENLPVITMWDSHGMGVPEFQRLQRLPENHDISPYFKSLRSGLGDDPRFLARDLYSSSINGKPGPVGIHLRDSECIELVNASSKIVQEAKPEIQNLSHFVKPVLIFGSACTHGKDRLNEIKSAFSSLPIPKLTTIGAKGLFPEDDAFSFRVFTGVGGERTPERAVLEAADLVIGINLRHSDVINVKAFNQSAILYDLDSREESYGFNAPVKVVSSVQKILDSIKDIGDIDWTADECRELFDHSMGRVLCEENESAVVIDLISKRLFDKCTVVVDDGIYQKQSEYAWVTNNEKQYVATGVGRNMGSALPAAIALAHRYPDQKIVCLTGDGGLPLFLGELGLVQEKNLSNLLVIQFADFELGSIRTAMAGKGIEGPREILEVKTDYKDVMSSFGFESIALDRSQSLEPIIDEWIQGNKSVFIEYELDKKHYCKSFYLIR